MRSDHRIPRQQKEQVSRGQKTDEEIGPVLTPKILREETKNKKHESNKQKVPETD